MLAPSGKISADAHAACSLHIKTTRVTSQNHWPPLPHVTIFHKSVDTLSPLRCDVIYGQPLSQKSLLLVVCALVVKGPSILLRTWTLRPDNAVEPVHNQNRTKWGSRANCQRWGARVCIDHFQVFCKDYSHPWNTNPGWLPPRHEWWPLATWSLCENHPTLWLIVSSGENHPTLWFVWVWGENHPALWLEWVFGFPVARRYG